MNTYTVIKRRDTQTALLSDGRTVAASQDVRAGDTVEVETDAHGTFVTAFTRPNLKREFATIVEAHEDYFYGAMFIGGPSIPLLVTSTVPLATGDLVAVDSYGGVKAVATEPGIVVTRNDGEATEYPATNPIAPILAFHGRENIRNLTVKGKPITLEPLNP